MPLPVFSNRSEVSELRIVDQLVYRGETELLKSDRKRKARSGNTGIGSVLH